MKLDCDITMAKQLLDLIAPKGKICFQTFKNTASFKGAPQWRYGSLDDLFPWLHEQNEHGAGIYFMVNEGDGMGRSAENVTKIRAVFVDLDGAPIGPVIGAACRPHAITETSQGHFQAFWLVSDAEVGDFKPMQQALSRRFSGDPAVCDPPRVMRLPGFFHRKRSAWMSRICKINNHKPFTMNELTMHLDLKVGNIQVPVETVAGEFVIPKGKRNQTMVTICARLRNAGLSGDDLAEALWIQNQKKCQPPLGRAEVDKILQWGSRLDSNPIRPARNRGVFDPTPSIEVMSWVDLKKRNYPPVKWIVQDLLPEGLTILAGRPKAGKSWMAQSLVASVSAGLPVLGYFQPNQGQCLSLALEDNERRFKSRMLKILDGKDPHPDAHFANQWPNLPHAIDKLQQWVEEHRECQLVVVDTLAKIRNRSQGKDGVYQADYEDIGAFQQFASQYGIAIVLVHHLRKASDNDADEFNAISGSAGLTGAADSMWVLTRPDRSAMQGVLQITGRDISDRKYSLRWDQDRAHWLYDGIGDKPQVDNDVHAKLLEVIQDLGGSCGIREAASIIDKPVSTVSRLMKEMEDLGLLLRPTKSGPFQLAIKEETIEMGTSDPYNVSGQFDMDDEEYPPMGNDVPEMDREECDADF